MKAGRLQDIIKVPLPRPRGDLAAIRGSQDFAQTRYKVWRALHDAAASH